MTLVAERVAVIDNEESARRELAFQLRGQGFEPVPIDESAASVDDVVDRVRTVAKFAVCDLRLSPWIVPLGAEIVARLTSFHVPTVLFTTSKEDDVPEFRHLLDRIPIFRTRDELNGDNLHELFDVAAESNLAAIPERAPYRTLLRVENMHSDQRAELLIPAWSLETPVEMSLSGFPEELRGSIRPGVRLFGAVNLHASDPSLLYVTHLSLAPEINADDGLG